MPKTTDIWDGEPGEPYTPPPRPTAEEDRADRIADDFDRVSEHPDDEMYHLSGACDALLRLGREARGRFQIGDTHRERLVMSILGAQMTVLFTAPPDFHQAVKDGFEGAVMVAAWLGADDERRASWPAETFEDARDYLTTLRNGAHSNSLRLDIMKREKARRALIVGDLLADAKRSAA